MIKTLVLSVSSFIFCGQALGFSLANETQFVVHASILTSSKTWVLHNFEVAPGETYQINLKKMNPATHLLRYISVSTDSFFSSKQSTWSAECLPGEDLVISYKNKHFMLTKNNQEH